MEIFAWLFLHPLIDARHQGKTVISSVTGKHLLIILRVIFMVPVCHSYLILCHLCVTWVSFVWLVCQSYVLLCHSYIPRMYSYVICMSFLCIRMSLICHSSVLVCHSHVICILFVCHSYVLSCHSYVFLPWTLNRCQKNSLETLMVTKLIHVFILCLTKATEMCLEPGKTSAVQLFAKIVNG